MTEFIKYYVLHSSSIQHNFFKSKLTFSMPLLLEHSAFQEKVISHKKNGFQFQTPVTEDDRKVDAEKTFSGKLCKSKDEEEAMRKWEIVNEEMILYYWKNFWIRFSFTRGNSLVVTYVSWNQQIFHEFFPHTICHNAGKVINLLSPDFVLWPVLYVQRGNVSYLLMCNSKWIYGTSQCGMSEKLTP